MLARECVARSCAAEEHARVDTPAAAVSCVRDDLPLAAEAGQVRGPERADRGGQMAGVDRRDRHGVDRWSACVLVDRLAATIEQKDRRGGPAREGDDGTPSGRELWIRLWYERDCADLDHRNLVADN